MTANCCRILQNYDKIYEVKDFTFGTETFQNFGRMQHEIGH